MTVKVKRTTITMTRGDTLRLKIGITDKDGNEYIPVDGDKIRFALKRDYSDEKPLILKEIPNDTLILQLDPEDTKTLEQPSEYVYDIQITLNDGTVDTFIAKAGFKLTEEVE